MSEFAVNREAEQVRPPMATTQVLLLFGLMMCALLLTLYYAFAIRTGLFSGQTHTLESGGVIVVLTSGFCIVAALCAMRFNVFAFPVIFMGACFMFNLGRFVFMILEDVQINWIIKSIPTRYFIQALPVVGLSFTALLVGVLVAALGNEKRRILHGNRRKPFDLENDWARVLRQIGYGLYFFAVGLTLYYALQGTGLALAIRYGYATRGGDGYAAASAAGQIPALATAALFWFMPWASFILLATAKGRLEQLFVIGLTLGTCVFTLLAGDRFVPIALIVGILSVGYLRGQRFKWWQVASVLFVIFLIVSTWSRIRTVSIREWDVNLFAETATRAVTGTYRTDERAEVQLNYAISGVFRQMGQSYIITPGTIKQIDDGEPYHYGVDYIRMMGSAIPFAGSYLVAWRQTPSEWFDDQYVNADSLRGLGFSIVAEAYLQGGAPAVFIVHFILGFSMTAIWFALERRPHPNAIAYIMIVISSVYIWVRDDMTEIAKPIVWGAGLTFIIPFIVIHAVRQMRQSGEQRVERTENE